MCVFIYEKIAVKKFLINYLNVDIRDEGVET